MVIMYYRQVIFPYHYEVMFPLHLIKRMKQPDVTMSVQ